MINEYVNEELDKLEDEFGIEILYAVESGSRAWGFANEDSDYDVRFYYKRPVEDYLSINDIRDVIDIHDLGHREYDYDLDISGWDVKKVLALHRKSNPSLREHLQSSIIYRGSCDFIKGLPSFNINTLKHSYGSMTYNNYMKYIYNTHIGNFTPRVIKTYCYCIRQILAWLRIEEFNDPNAPINIDELLSLSRQGNILGEGLLDNMQDCIDYYRSNCRNNQFNEEKLLDLDKWIRIYLEVIKTPQDKIQSLPDIEIYNQRFREIILGSR